MEPVNPGRVQLVDNEAWAHMCPDAMVSVVTPTLNEAENLAFVLNVIPAWVNEISAADVRSANDSVRVAKVLRPDVHIIHEGRRGKVAALRTDLATACGDIRIIMDGDRSSDDADIQAFRDALISGAEYVKCCRFCVGFRCFRVIVLKKLRGRDVAPA